MEQSFLTLFTDYYFWGALGFCAGCCLAVRNLVKNGLGFPAAVLSVLFMLYAGLIGSRILIVLSENPRLFLYDPSQGIIFWQGGLSWFGGPLLCAATGLLFFKMIGKPAWPHMGCVPQGLAVAHAISRIGCLFNGCCYGAPTNVPWAIFSSRLNTRVHPTQLYDMAGELLVAAVLQYAWRDRGKRKYLMPAYGILMSAHRFVSESFRGGPPGPEVFDGLRFYQSVAIVVIMGCTVIVLCQWAGRRGLYAAGVLVLPTIVAFAWLRPAPDVQHTKPHEKPSRYLVVTREMFADHLAPWKTAREHQGFSVVVGEWKDPPKPEDIHEWIRRQALEVCSYILLVGDCHAENNSAPWHLPAAGLFCAQSPDTLTAASDLRYGDLDDDGLPDVPVGRLPVRNLAQLKTQLGKILEFDRRQVRPEWFRAVLWVGAAGYQTPMHMAATSLRETLPLWLDTYLISGKIDSPFSGWPPDQPEIFLRAISEPALLSVIVSHGSFRSVTPAGYEDKDIFLSVEDVTRLESERALGPLFLMGCDSGAFNTTEDQGPSLSEAFFAHPCGPIAVVAASGPTNPLTNYGLSQAMIHGLSAAPETVGGFWIEALRFAWREGEGSLLEIAAADPLAHDMLAVMPDQDRARMTDNHRLQSELLLYNILGDPATRLHMPSPIQVSVTTGGEGGDITASGTTPPGARELYIDLVRPAQIMEILPPGLSEKERHARLEAVNRRPEVVHRTRLRADTWEARVPTSSDSTDGAGYLRFIVTGAQTSGWFCCPLPLN